MKKNFCFDRNTPLVYRETLDGEIKIDPIKEVFRNHKDDAIYVCGMTLDEEEHKAQLNWTKANLCHTNTSKVISIYLQPTGFIPESTLESENIIRVTPNHIFPILGTNGVRNQEAYLIQTGTIMIFEHSRDYGEFEQPLFLEDGEVAIEDILEENSWHTTEYRKVAKVIEEDTDVDGGYDFYGITLLDTDNKYFMLCNSVITHDSSVDYL